MELLTKKRTEKWEYSFEIEKINRKRKRVSKSGFKTKKEAIAAGTKAMFEYNQSGMTFEPSEITVHDYFNLR